MKTIKPPHKIVFMSTFPPTQCGIATFTDDTVRALLGLNGKSITCEIAEITFKGLPSATSTYHLPSADIIAYERVASEINEDDAVKLVHIQHEFGLFGGSYGSNLFHFLNVNQKPIAYTFHSVIANPNDELKTVVQLLCSYSEAIIVMTEQSKEILIADYSINEKHIFVVPHGTHLVDYEPTQIAKQKLGLSTRLVLSTFGLISEGKSIETGIKAMSTIVKSFPNALYLILGKTHPNTLSDGIDTYRHHLEALVEHESLEENVRFVDEYLDTPTLLDYLKATDVYLFTSKDPNQAVSGTFSYAMSCSCPIVASSIPHTREFLSSDMGVLVPIQDAAQFANAAKRLLADDRLRQQMGLNAYAKTTQSSWENTALKHLNVYQQLVPELSNCKITYPKIKLDHLKRLTTEIGVVQFCKISKPDLSSGYTLDDNARALLLVCNYFELTNDDTMVGYITKYLNFIAFCQLEHGHFINYIKEDCTIEERNYSENLEDANGRALWALGSLLALKTSAIPLSVIEKATQLFDSSLKPLLDYRSPRALAFALKGLCKLHSVTTLTDYTPTIVLLAERLAEYYRKNASATWRWFEHQLTYANAVLPEALLLSYTVTKREDFKEIALESMSFLCSKMFLNDTFKIISNKGWLQKDALPYAFGEQPIEACYMMFALDSFYSQFGDATYKVQLKLAFDWFLGKNHLHHTIYNAVTGGCYDGLERDNVNLNQGAESTICYLLSRLLIEKYSSTKPNEKTNSAHMLSKLKEKALQ